MAKSEMTAADVMAVIEKNFKAPEYALLREVGNSTGYSCHRHADAVALSLWPSRGIYLRGFEVKVSRSDWLHELKQPKKSAEVQRYCTRWDVVVPDEKIVDLSEVPERWGLLVAERKGNRLRTVKDGPILTPEPLSVGFVAAVIRRAAEGQRQALTQEYQRGYEAGKADAPEITTREEQRKVEQLQKLQATVEAFEKASGLEISSPWNGPRIGEAVAALRDLSRHGSPLDIINGAINQTHAMLRSMREVQATARAIEASGIAFSHHVPEPKEDAAQ